MPQIQRSLHDAIEEGTDEAMVLQPLPIVRKSCRVEHILRRVHVQNLTFPRLGGPGVGKTTVVDAIVRVLAAKGLRIVQPAQSGIVQNAHRVNQGQFLQLNQQALDGHEPGDFFYVEGEDPERATVTMERLVLAPSPRGQRSGEKSGRSLSRYDSTELRTIQQAASVFL